MGIQLTTLRIWAIWGRADLAPVGPGRAIAPPFLKWIPKGIVRYSCCKVHFFEVDANLEEARSGGKHTFFDLYTKEVVRRAS